MIQKRIFDVFFSFLMIAVLFPFLVLFFVVASVDTSANGLFIQQRIGRFGNPFSIYKFRTIHPQKNTISKIGNFFRKYKIDELPQLFNILKGEMTFVGPRPDIAGYYDVLKGENRKVLQLKPGLTSEASIKYRNEEELLSEMENPLQYNDEILFPDKVKMNLEYLEKMSLKTDLKIIIKTITTIFEK
ncbi:MAG: sugar transferase [Bergeyella sp.]